MNAKTISIYFSMLAGVILAGYYGPWWAPAVFVVLLSGLMQLATKKAIMTGAVSMGVVYLAMTIWMNSLDKADIIGKTGMLLGGLSHTGMIVVTTLIGAITGALSGWLGSVLSGIFQKK